MIAEESIKELLERASISEIVGEVVQLKRAGQNQVGLCPFHSEKSPSFNVRENDGFFHCFGCGESGNVFKFLMEIKGLSFPEAAEELASRYGVRLKYEGTKPQGPAPSSKDPIYAVNMLALQYFVRALREAPPQVSGYVQKRQITDPTLKTFGIGYAANSRAALFEFLKSQHVPEETIFLAALARRNEQGDAYDVFRGRLIFPVWLDQKKIAGFGGRIIPQLFDEETLARFPKYLNSPETPVYQKSKILYGIPQALPALRETDTAYIVEGYMDVVSLNQAGVRNVLATCGTALTDLHVRKLTQLAKKVTVLFDGDAAGRNAAGKSFTTFLNSGIDVAALFLPQEDDPDTIALKYAERSTEYLDGLPRKSLLDCHIEYLLGKFGVKEVRDLGSALKGKLADELAEAIHLVRNNVERAEYVERAALVLRIDPHDLSEMVRTAKGPRAAAPGAEIVSEEVSEDDRAAIAVPIEELPRVDRELLLCSMALKDSLPAKILKDGDLCTAIHPRTLAFVENLHVIVNDPALDETQKKERLKQLLKLFGNSWAEYWRSAYTMIKDKSVDPAQAFEECRRSIKKTKLLRLVSEIDREIALTSEDAEKMILVQRKFRLSRQIAELGGTHG